MSILNYFKRKNGHGLPDPKGSLSSSIAPSTIAAANAEVKAVLKGNSASSENKHGKRGRYNR